MNNQTKASSERVYALDALRAIMMLLGLVIHASITYGSIDYGATWPLKDPNNSLVFDLVFSLIHAFRMPVFFVAAGYFGALLFYKKGPRAMLLNRVKRILLPFLAGVLIVYPLVVFAFIYSRSAFAAAPSPSGNAFSFIVSGDFLPFNIVHLWFLYFLVMYAVVGCLLAMAFNKKTAFTESANKIFKYVLENFWLRLLCMALVFFLCLYWMNTPYIKTNNKWSIDPATFITYFVFFGTGWMLYLTNSLESLKQYPIWQLSIAVMLFLISTFAPWPANIWVLHSKQAFTAIYTSLFIFGFIAFFLTYFNSYSPRLGYIMDASYWVYIIHLPIVAFIPGLLAGFALPPALKFAITLSLTTIICFATYKYFVRATVIGMFLNGKVHKQKKTHIVNDMVLES
ncbi:MAG: acyltransferase family protein [Bacteroidota bacterium]